jgi:hypothetical protein
MLSKLLPLLFLAITTTSIAQETVTGTVVDDKTGAPVSGANIYINKTQSGTVSGSDGSFAIRPGVAERVELVVSHVQYEKKIIILDKNERLAIKIRLLPKVSELGEIVVQSRNKENWKKWGSLFFDYFIGSSVFASDCEILNHDVLRFSFTNNEQRLRVKAGDKLLVRNNALGYVYHIDLDSFAYSFQTNSIVYTYTVFFEELQGVGLAERNEFQKKRLLAYLGSRIHFMRSLYQNRLQGEGFEVFRFVASLNTEKQRVNNLLLAQQAKDIRTDRGTGGDARRTVIMNKDSAAYYRSVLREADYIFNDSVRLFPGDHIRRNSVAAGLAEFYFADTMLVRYNPHDSIFKRRAYKGIDKYKFRQHQFAEYTKNGSPLARNQSGSYLHASILYLVNPEPIFIQADGLYFEGLNLFTDGAMGWKKIANLLPWEYEPGN